MNILDSFPPSIDCDAELALLKKNKKTEVVLASMREAVLYGRTCCGGKLDDSELVSLCYEALQKTVTLFDAKRGLRFFSFSKPRIRGAILRHFNNTSTVRNAECISLQVAEGHEEEAENMYAAMEHYEVYDDFNFDLVNFRERWSEIHRYVMRTCSDRDCTIMFLVFSLDFTFDQAGKVFGITRSATQAIAARIILDVKRSILK